MLITRVLKLTGPTLRAEIAAVRGNAASLPLIFHSVTDGVHELLDLEDMAFELRITNRTTGAAVYTFAGADCGVIVATATVEPMWTMAQSLTVPLGVYNFTFVAINDDAEEVTMISGTWRQTES